MSIEQRTLHNGDLQALFHFLGGSRVQVFRPAAFVVIIYGITSPSHGMADLTVAAHGGTVLIIMGLLRFGDSSFPKPSRPALP